MTDTDTETEEFELPHLIGCFNHDDPDMPSRTEDTVYEDEGIVTHHCLDCGAHEATNLADGSYRQKPTSVGPFAGTKFDAFAVTMERAEDRPGGRR